MKGNNEEFRRLIFISVLAIFAYVLIFLLFPSFLVGYGIFKAIKHIPVRWYDYLFLFIFIGIMASHIRRVVRKLRK